MSAVCAFPLLGMNRVDNTEVCKIPHILTAAIYSLNWTWNLEIIVPVSKSPLLLNVYRLTVLHFKELA